MKENIIPDIKYTRKTEKEKIRNLLHRIKTTNTLNIEMMKVYVDREKKQRKRFGTNHDSHIQHILSRT